MILTPSQREVIRIACQGHDLLVTGQAGTGKSTIVTEIISKLRAAGKSVALVCSSGMSCSVYRPGLASTVHSYYGLRTAELPARELIHRSLKNEIRDLKHRQRNQTTTTNSNRVKTGTERFVQWRKRRENKT